MRKILITNDTLNTRFGAELVTRDLALGLAAAGEWPVIYTPRPGDVAAELQANGITVVDRLEKVPFYPEIIHGNQHVEMVQAMFAYPQARGVFVCHARLGWPATPPLFEGVSTFVAAGHNSLERLVDDYRIPKESTAVILNSVDLARFILR